MKTVIITCDICGRDVLGGSGGGILHPAGNPNVPPKYVITSLMKKDAIEDICQTCATKIHNLIECLRKEKENE